MSNKSIVGIDLGTTNSAIGCMVNGEPQLIPNTLQQVLTPSVVGVDLDGQIVVGRAAQELQVMYPERCAGAFKRHMGSDWTIQLADHDFTPEKLSSLVLQSLKADAEAFLGHAVDAAVITVPAYFNEYQRRATIQAGQLAGLQVERILNEPTAAAIAYGLHDDQTQQVILVVDLGGGTFDVAVMNVFETLLEVRASSGESFLGGEDFTSNMVSRILERRGMVYEQAELRSPKLVSRMRQLCELAKRQLSREDSVTVRIPDDQGRLPQDAAEVLITRKEFTEWTGATLQRTEIPLRRALGDAGLTRSDIDQVVLVGGATRMPQLRERIVRLFGKEPHCRLNPDEVVALGAVVQAGLIARDKHLEDVIVTDVSPFTLGIEISHTLAGQKQGGYFMPVIPRNRSIPVSCVESVTTLQPNQTEVTLKIYQGEARMVKDNLCLGTLDLKGIPAGPAGSESVSVRFTYDLNGVLEVEATVVSTGKTRSQVLTQHTQGMSDRQIQKAVQEMQALKTHPRDETEIRFLLRRSERVYQELPFEKQRLLDALLTGFEEALELQDANLIDRYRAKLTEFLDIVDYQDDEADLNDDTEW
jgi:molecular chaperone HscC